MRCVPFRGGLCFHTGCFIGSKNNTLQGINISHLGKRKIIFKMPFLVDMLVSCRVYQTWSQNTTNCFPYCLHTHTHWPSHFCTFGTNGASRLKSLNFSLDAGPSKWPGEMFNTWDIIIIIIIGHHAASGDLEVFSVKYVKSLHLVRSHISTCKRNIRETCHMTPD